MYSWMRCWVGGQRGGGPWVDGFCGSRQAGYCADPRNFLPTPLSSVHVCFTASKRKLLSFWLLKNYQVNLLTHYAHLNPGSKCPPEPHLTQEGRIVCGMLRGCSRGIEETLWVCTKVRLWWNEQSNAFKISVDQRATYPLQGFSNITEE